MKIVGLGMACATGFAISVTPVFATSIHPVDPNSGTGGVSITSVTQSYCGSAYTTWMYADLEPNPTPIAPPQISVESVPLESASNSGDYRRKKCPTCPLVPGTCAGCLTVSGQAVEVSLYGPLVEAPSKPSIVPRLECEGIGLHLLATIHSSAVRNKPSGNFWRPRVDLRIALFESKILLDQRWIVAGDTTTTPALFQEWIDASNPIQRKPMKALDVLTPEKLEAVQAPIRLANRLAALTPMLGDWCGRSIEQPGNSEEKIHLTLKRETNTIRVHVKQWTSAGSQSFDLWPDSAASPLYAEVELRDTQHPTDENTWLLDPGIYRLTTGPKQTARRVYPFTTSCAGF